ncbi:MAG: hypothetical protein V3V55_00640 [Rhodospirillales bacterium]
MFGRRKTQQEAVDKKPVPRRAPEPRPVAVVPAAAALEPERVASKPEPAAPEPAAPEPERVASKPELVEPTAERMADIGMVPSAAAIERLAEIKVAVFNDLLEAVDLAEISKLRPDEVREEITDMVAEIISMRNLIMSAQEQQQVIFDIINDILGLGHC